MLGGFALGEAMPVLGLDLVQVTVLGPRVLMKLHRWELAPAKVSW